MATTRGYWIERPGEGSIRTVPLPAARSDQVRLRALCTGVSPGTERLVGSGKVPATWEPTMAVPGMQGSFALPLLYGYSFVGEALDGPRRGERAFTMLPHQQEALVSEAACRWLPLAVPSARATLFANLETAQNAVWDAELRAREQVLVVGGGAVGALLAFVLAEQHQTESAICEADPVRRAQLSSLPWVRHVLAPEAVPAGAFNVAMHSSGAASGLQLAIDAVGFEGRVVELSWYGDRPVTLHLGGTFHWQRKRIVGSQVGTVAPSHRASGHAGRASAVLQLLQSPALDLLMADPIPFETLPAFFGRLYRHADTPLCPVVSYP